MRSIPHRLSPLTLRLSGAVQDSAPAPAPAAAVSSSKRAEASRSQMEAARLMKAGEYAKAGTLLDHAISLLNSMNEEA